MARKKVAIAQIVSKNVDIILLDEPTSNIQKEYAIDLLNFIFNEFKDKIFIIVSHDNLYKKYNGHFVKIKLMNEHVHYEV